MLTFVFNINLGVDEFIPLQGFSKTSILMFCLLVWESPTEWQIIVIVCLLGVVVRAYFVDPQHHTLTVFILNDKAELSHNVSRLCAEAERYPTLHTLTL